MSKLLVGCDPEYLAISGNKFRSVIGLLKGTKEEPSPLEEGTVQVDNVSAEIGIIPAESSEDFDRRIRIVREQVACLLKPYGMQLSSAASAEFDDDELAHPDAQVFGCDPDFNAWEGGKMNIPPLRGMNLRVAGGHIHVGTELSGIDQQIQLIKALDLTIGVPSLHLEDMRRKMMYGKAGAFRPKKYGVEYRTPSNFWTLNSARRKWAFAAVEKALGFLSTDIPTVVREVIDNYDVDGAQGIINHFNLEVCPYE